MARLGNKLELADELLVVQDPAHQELPAVRVAHSVPE